MLGLNPVDLGYILAVVAGFHRMALHMGEPQIIVAVVAADLVWNDVLNIVSLTNLDLAAA